MVVASSLGAEMRSWRSRLTVVMFATGVVLGCDDDPMRTGTAAVLSGQPDVAEQSLQKVLKKDPGNGEAARLMAEVQRLRGNFAASEKALDVLWQERGFVSEATNPEDKALRKRIEQQYSDLYVEWVEKIDPREDAELYEAVMRRGLARDPRSTRLNTLMVEFLLAGAERALELMDKKGAAEKYEEVLKFRTLPNVQQDAETRARNLRLELFGDAIRKRVEEEVKPRRLAAEQWSAERQGAAQTVVLELDRGLRPETPGDLEKARAQALPAVQKALAEILSDVAGKPVAVEAVVGKLPVHHTEGEAFKRGSYTIRVMVSTDVAINYLFELEASAQAKGAEPAVVGDDAAVVDEKGTP